MPYVDWGEGHMAPWAAFLSYVNTDDDSIRDALYIDEDTVPPTAIRFTTGDHEMIYYVYDTRDGMSHHHASRIFMIVY